jgi:hypothetical protein
LRLGLNNQAPETWVGLKQEHLYCLCNATTITVASGAASIYQKGDKLRFKQTAGTYVYMYVVSVADTVLTVTGGSDYTVANEAITVPAYSHIENPLGFPQWFNLTAPVWDVAVYDDGSGGQPTTTECRFKISGNLYTVHYRGTGVKAATANQIYTTSTSFIASANTTTHVSVGTCIGYITDFIFGFVSNNFTIIFTANITDNATISHFGFTMTYEI